MGLTVEHQLKVAGCCVGLAKSMQFDVAQQQGDKSPPADYSCLRFCIRRRVLELGQQISGDPAGIVVARFGEGVLGVLIALLEFAVHELGVP